MVLDVQTNCSDPKRGSSSSMGWEPPRDAPAQETHREPGMRGAGDGEDHRPLQDCRGRDPACQATCQTRRPPVADMGPHTHEPANKAHFLRPTFKWEREGWCRERKKKWRVKRGQNERMAWGEHEEEERVSSPKMEKVVTLVGKGRKAKWGKRDQRKKWGKREEDAQG